MSKVGLGFILLMVLTNNEVTDTMYFIGAMCLVLDVLRDTFKGK